MIFSDDKTFSLDTISAGDLQLIAGGHSAGRTVKLAFTSSKGGYSGGAYASLNLSLKVQDDTSSVQKNREKLFDILGLPLSNASMPEQVHGDKIEIVDGKHGEINVVPDCDGLITSETGVPLMALFADCIPVLIFDRHSKVAGVIHAGWRGTHKRIAKKAVEMIKLQHRLDNSDLIAVIGPGIADCCYEVGGELAQNFIAYQHAIRRTGNRIFLNLKSVNRSQLIEAGLKNESIFDVNICTGCNRSYFSYRRDNGMTGRHGAVICIMDHD